MSTQGVISDHKIKCQPVFSSAHMYDKNVSSISSFFELSYYCKSMSAQSYPPISLTFKAMAKHSKDVINYKNPFAHAARSGQI